MNRKPFKIKEWMRGQSVTVSGVASELGISKSIVSETIYGKRNHRETLALLRSMGCPEAFLSLPKDMLEAAA
jgi:predicted transcriptional regulator